ncbi:hypothetical protein BaRGS_00025254 [Batillaria attramentaria]|uniref:RNA helicase n=1 Tax=Batillaria attramentaria TaxID=370345 RepID=A0ABD0K8T5_9CAEN
MAEQSQVSDDQMKLEILQSMIPDFVRHNFDPNLIVPDLCILEDHQQDEILLLDEAGNRAGAVEKLINMVVEKKEEGLNHFLYLLEGRDGTPRWERFLQPFEGSQAERNQAANEYFALTVRLLKGDIIEHLTDAEKTEPGLSPENVSEKDVENNSEHTEQTFVKEAVGSQEGLHEQPGQQGGKRQYSREFLLQLQFSSQRTSRDLFSDIFAPHMFQAGSNDTLVQYDSDDFDAEGEHLPASDLETDRDPGFSDDEKADYEKPEKEIGALQRKQLGPQDLELRNYQKELAEAALSGLNTIICAPTGSGKTRVATHIIEQHFQAETQAPAVDQQGENVSRKRKVVFMAHTGALATQQFKNFKQFLPYLKTVIITGQSKDCMNMHMLLPDNDIFVVTPKILENHLSPDKIPSLEVFSLLVFDECHHTKKGEPYMSVMKNYLKTKNEGQVVPQIVGLTASISVEGASTTHQAVQSVLKIMANLDVHHISVVEENLPELRRTVYKPQEMDPIQLTPRREDEVSRKMDNIMHKIEELLNKRATEMADAKVDAVLRKLSERPPDHKDQSYGQWAVGLYDQARQLKAHQSCEEAENQRRKTFAQEVRLMAKWLTAFNVALDVHDLTCPQDVLHYLERKLDRPFDYRSPVEAQLFEFFEDLEKTLTKATESNPNLDILEHTIQKHLSERKDEESRILVFVRTRATCRAVSRWLNSSEVYSDLQQLNAMAFTGIGAQQSKGGMTPIGQLAVLEKFRNGEVKVLVSTSIAEEGIDIPECDFTIKYNRVGNEVTTVQTRGRSRKHGGKSILLGMQNIIEQERLNRHREELMNHAILQIREMPEDTVIETIAEFQREILTAAEIEERKRKRDTPILKKGDFILESDCSHVRVPGSLIRTINGNHRAIIGHDIDDRVNTRKNPARYKKPNTDDVDLTGSFFCNECDQYLGQVACYKKTTFFTVGLRSKSWIILDANEEPLSPQYKKWSKVPYRQAPISLEDIRQHAEYLQDDDMDAEAEEDIGAVGGADV